MAEQGFDAGQKCEAVHAHIFILGIDEDGVEESISWCAQRFEAAQGVFAIFAVNTIFEF